MGNATSATNKMPDHWKLNEEFPSISSAVEGLQGEGLPYRMYTVKDTEKDVIQSLAIYTWQKDKVGMGRDARNLSHTCIQIDNVERIENPQLLDNYKAMKAKMMRNPAPCQPLKTAQGSTGPVMTEPFLQAIQNNIIGQDISSKINECYLFHGTTEDIADIICRDGLDIRFCSEHSLLGRGLYTAESSTKSDQYTDIKTDRNDNTKKMFLVRVLLGDPYINTDPNPPKFQRPPCKNCKQIICTCGSTSYYDSVVDNAGRLFREFVVYDKGQCYPEYLITYRRVQDSGVRNYGSLKLKPSSQNVVIDGQIVVQLSDNLSDSEQSYATFWSQASAKEKVLLLLACTVLFATLLNAVLMTIFCLEYIGDCQGSPGVPITTFILGVMTYLVYITLPYMLLDWCGDDTALITKKSFRIVLAAHFFIQAIIQIANWAVVFASKNPCSGTLGGFAAASASIQIIIYITLPLSLYLLYKNARPFYMTAMRLIGYLTKISLSLAIIGIVVLPISSIVAGANCAEKCPALTPKLPVYLFGSGIILFLAEAMIVMFLICYKPTFDQIFTEPPYIIAWMSGLGLLQFIFQIVGYAAVYPYKLGIDVSGDPAKNNYCDEAVYNISFANLTFSVFLYFYMPPFLYVAIKHYDLIDIIWKRFSCCHDADEDDEDDE